MMAEAQPNIYIVDDDAAVRQALSSLIRSVGLGVQTFASGAEFLGAERQDAPCCVLLDVRMGGMSGLDLQAEMAKTLIEIPIIFITGHGDIPMAVRVMKAGAMEFLTKPIRDQDLLDAIQHGIQTSRVSRQKRREAAALRERFASLTPRETQVIEHVVHGFLNKQIAAKLGTSEKTVKHQRAQAMRKMRAQSLPDLVRMVDQRDSQV